MQRIVVIGTSCSGKTTLGKQLSQKTGIPAIDLDDLFWLPNWENVSREELISKVSRVTSQTKWIISGNYSYLRDSMWKKADTVIWLNYPFHIIWKRALHRTFRRSLTQELVCNGNRETLFKAFCTRDSILLWVLKTYHRRRKEYPAFMQDPQYAHINFLEFNHPDQTEKWLQIQGRLCTQSEIVT